MFSYNRRRGFYPQSIPKPLFMKKILKEYSTSNNNVVKIVLIGGDEYGKISNT